jgi:hypothetical protein
MWGTQQPLAAGAIAERLALPLATVTAAIVRLEAATIVSRFPQDWV